MFAAFQIAFNNMNFPICILSYPDKKKRKFSHVPVKFIVRINTENVLKA